MIKNIKEKIIWQIKQLVHLEKDIVIIEIGNIIQLEVKGRPFCLYLKSLTYAGNPYPRNTTRAQLPQREEFEAIKDSDSIFLFFGYDEKNEVIACWDPVKTKNRLNLKQYVSFFSRLVLQESVVQGNIVSASLQNDYKYVLFKINDLAYFLLHITDYFPNIQFEHATIAISKNANGVLSKIEDDNSVKLLIDELISMNDDVSDLTLMSSCMNEFGEFYHKMTLKDWHNIVKTYRCKKKLSTFEKEEDSTPLFLAAEPLLPPQEDIPSKKVEKGGDFATLSKIKQSSLTVTVGDLILYDSRECVVISIKDEVSSKRLKIRYKDGTVDDVQYDNKRFCVLKSKSYNKNEDSTSAELSYSKKKNVIDRTPEKLFDHYSYRILQMKQAVVHGEKILAKPALLVAVIDAISEHKIQHNDFILTNWLEGRYNTILARYASVNQLKQLTSIEMPFWHLQFDGFWHLTYKGANIYSPSKRWIKEHIISTKLDDDLWLILQYNSWRQKMRKFIIENKLISCRKSQIIDAENDNQSLKTDDKQYTIDGENTITSVGDSKPLNKRRFVLETVKNYVRLHPQVAYETLIRVFPASLNFNQANGVIKRYKDVLKRIALNPHMRNYFFLKDDEIIQLSNGMKVVVHSQWGDDFAKFLKVAKKLFNVTICDDGFILEMTPPSITKEKDDLQKNLAEVDSKDDYRIGYTVRLFPSQLKGEIIRVRTDSKGIKKLIIKTTEDNIVEVNDMPYLYEVLKRKNVTGTG